MVINHQTIVFIDYIFFILSIPLFVGLSLYMWIKTGNKIISRISLIIFLISLVGSIVLFLLFLFGVVNTHTEVPGFFSRYIESVLSKQNLDISTLSYIAWFILVLSWWYVTPIIKKFKSFSFPIRGRSRITFFLSSHQYSVVISFSVIYVLLLLISVIDFFSGRNSYWLLFLFYWSIFVLFSAAPPYASMILCPKKTKM